MEVKTSHVIVILLIMATLSVVLVATRFQDYNAEGFQAVVTPSPVDKISEDIGKLNPAEKEALLKDMRTRLAEYNLLPSEREMEVDRSQWVPKSAIPPPGPRIDLSQYVKKSSIPPEKVCPPQKEIDYSQYVKKSTLPPVQKCPPCISPAVKVSAGLCKTCPACPACPPPKRCPELKCPEPEPCTKTECPKCSEIKYIKVPTIITRTIKVDKNDNIISEQVENKTPEQPDDQSTKIPLTTRMENRQKSCGVVGLNSEFKKYGVYGYN